MARSKLLDSYNLEKNPVAARVAAPAAKPATKEPEPAAKVPINGIGILYFPDANEYRAVTCRGSEVEIGESVLPSYVKTGYPQMDWVVMAHRMAAYCGRRGKGRHALLPDAEAGVFASRLRDGK